MGKVKKKPKAAKQPAFGEVLTLAQAAAYLQVDEAGLKHDAVAGRVPAGLVAGEWRFGRQALLAWLASPWTGRLADSSAKLTDALRGMHEAAASHDADKECEAFQELLRAQRSHDELLMELPGRGSE